MILCRHDLKALQDPWKLETLSEKGNGDGKHGGKVKAVKSKFPLQMNQWYVHLT